MRTSRLRVSLRYVVPEVIRVVDVPASSTLPELHDLLQAALGWTNSHLHQFVAGETRYGVPDDEDWEEQCDEAGVRLRDLPGAFTYLYDFGDGWEHGVEVLGPGGDRPGCVYGEGACPPEDSGGPHGYLELLEVLADPTHEDHAHMREWAGDLTDFDQAAADLLVRQTVGQVPASVRLVLDLAEPGVKLTPGGRLPRAFVRQVQEQRPHWYGLGRPASIEEDLPPLSGLHVVLRQVGLLRLSNGVLRPTKAARDDLDVVRRLRSWFQPEAFTTLLAGVSIALLETAGPQRGEELAAKVHPLLGHGWSSGGQRLTEHDVRISMGQISSTLRGLDQIVTDWPLWSAGPSARSLLPQATGLAALWSKSSADVEEASPSRPG
jgi:hypothetical protein